MTGKFSVSFLEENTRPLFLRIFLNSSNKCTIFSRNTRPLMHLQRVTPGSDLILCNQELVDVHMRESHHNLVALRATNVIEDL